MTTAFVCSGCGGGSVEINEARPSLDDRYPVGHCMSCTPWPKAKPHPIKKNETIQPPRKTIALVRADLFDVDDFRHRRRVAEARRLAKKLDSKTAAKMSPAQLEEASRAVAWLQRDE